MSNDNFVHNPSPDGQGHPYSDPGLVTNQVLRVLFAITGTLLCWVPFRLLCKNGEFAAVVLVATIVVMNFFTITNALLWGSDSWDEWWDGVGLCDLEVYLSAPLNTIYAACIFVIMRHLAEQVGMTRVSAVSRKERRRKHLIQAAIIFPIPILQIILTWFSMAQRYIIGTLVGCYATYDNSWVKIVVIAMPPAAFAVFTVPYTILTWKRFRAISKATMEIMTTNSAVYARAQRTRRRLYQMALSILVPYVPLQMVFLALNVSDTQFHAYDYWNLHYVNDPYAWNSIMFIPSWMVPFGIINQPWIAILTTLPIVLFFGMTNDAIETYRQYALTLGFAKCLPKLMEAWDPDRPPRSYSDRSWTSPMANSARRQINKTPANQDPPLTPGVLSVASPDRSSSQPYHQPIISSNGPFIPPRHSSLHRSLLSRSLSKIPTMPRIPSLSTLRGGSNKDDVAVNACKNKGSMDTSAASSDLSIQMMPLVTMASVDARRDPGTLPSTHPLAYDQGIVPREMAMGNGSRSSYRWRP